MERSGTGGADVSVQMSKRQRGVATDRQASASASGISLQASASAGGTQGRRRQEVFPNADQSHVEKHAEAPWRYFQCHVKRRQKAERRWIAGGK